MRLEDIHLVHSLPGRLRFKLEGLKGQPDQAREIEARLAEVRGMQGVQASSLTGSVVAKYDPAVLESLDLYVAIANAMGIAASDLNSESLARWHAKETQDVRSSPPDAVRNWRILVPLVLCLFGVRAALMTNKLTYPQWYDYLWFAFGTYVALNPSKSTTPEQTRREV